MKKRVNFSIDEDVLILFDKLVNQRHTTRSQFITDIIMEHFLSNEKFEQKLVGQPRG